MKYFVNDFLSFLMIFLPVAWIDQSMPVGEWHGLENLMTNSTQQDSLYLIGMLILLHIFIQSLLYINLG